jgi:NADH-ubiquinone oxidoreductase chain 2
MVSLIVLQLTGFFPRKIIGTKALIFTKLIFVNIYNIILRSTTKIINKMAGQFVIIEYALIILFIISGAVLLLSSSDLVSVFLCIELQSYGLYLLCVLYRNSELATASGLTYFLLGGLSSCLILLGIAIIYVNSGITNLESFYVISSISKEIFNSNNDIIN